MATKIKDLSPEEHEKLKNECYQIISENCNFKTSAKRDNALKLLKLLQSNPPVEVDKISHIEIKLEL